MPLVRAALVLILCLCSALEALAQDEAQAEMARLRAQVAWQRTSPNAKAIDGPVLYQIIMRSSATQGHIPKISNTFTLTNSLISEDVNGIHIGTMSVDSAGIITFANGQNFPGGGVTSITVGAGLTPTGPITTSGSIALDTSFTDSLYASLSSLASYLLLSGGTMTGALQLSGDPTQPLHAATKAYVDAGLLANKNSLGVLAADYEFDETSGTSFADSSGFNNTATNTPPGGIAPGSAGHTGKAITFAGGVVTATNTPYSPQVWVEGWVSYTNGFPNGTILNKTGVYALALNSGTVTFTVNAANGMCLVGSAPLPAGAFFHAGGWYNGLTAVVEANGKTTEVPCAKGPLVPANQLFIGAANGSGMNPFNGTIDEVRVRTVAPPPAQVTPTPTNQYCGSTLATTGQLASLSGGYHAAAVLCQTACNSPAATMCTATDMVHSAQLGISLPSNVWYSSGTFVPVTTNSTFVTDCNGWTEGPPGTPYDGPTWVTGAPSIATCSSSLPIACCTLK
ncbi:MAG TPA: LamG-like jellyroll fold domain-containing protein [Terriglobales bacterium]|jgi:hypothetical protein|nr:LamG-like jellyroll fold domain-containing protein [Terriglobales bacterium]